MSLIVMKRAMLTAIDLLLKLMILFLDKNLREKTKDARFQEQRIYFLNRTAAS